MRTIGELRAALTMGHGFPGDADDFEANLACEINHSDLTGVVRLVEEFRGRMSPARNPNLISQSNRMEEGRMVRTVVDVDDELHAETAEIFGTKTKAATANETLGDPIKRLKRASFLGWLAEGGLPDLTGPVETTDHSHHSLADPHQAA
ncbi:hypothetical protein [Streptomyces adonidis]|uniref:hypothetical protein n=1 Tax=Streptomyces adonidis TaxID=3231367 RepID=UPI0034DB62FB